LERLAAFTDRADKLERLAAFIDRADKLERLAAFIDRADKLAWLAARLEGSLRTGLADAVALGVLTTMAFLVAFSVLIRDFFWMVTVFSPGEAFWDLTRYGCAVSTTVSKACARFTSSKLRAESMSWSFYGGGEILRATGEMFTLVKN
jgi:hypothetical protein